MKKRSHYLFLTLFSLFATKGFSEDAVSDCAKWIQEIGPKKFFREFSYDVLCPKRLSLQQFEILDEDSHSLNAPIISLPSFPFIGFQYRGDISIVHYAEGRLPLHHFELKESFDDKKTLPVFEQGGILSFKCYYEVILNKDGELVTGAKEYETRYYLTLHGEIIDRKRFLALLEK